MGRFPQKKAKGGDKKPAKKEGAAFVPKYEYFAKQKLASYPNEDGTCVHLGKGQDEKGFFALKSILQTRSGRNEELCRRIGMGLALDAASLDHGVKLLKKHFGGELPQGLHKTGLPKLMELLDSDGGQEFGKALETLNVGKSRQPKEKAVKKAMEVFVEYLTEDKDSLQRSLSRLASDAAALYLFSMTCLKDMAMLASPQEWAGKIEGTQGDAVRAWQRKPKSREKMMTALVSELMSKISKNEVGQKRKASDSSSVAPAASASSEATADPSPSKKGSGSESDSSGQSSKQPPAADSSSSSSSKKSKKKRPEENGKKPKDKEKKEKTKENTKSKKSKGAKEKKEAKEAKHDKKEEKETKKVRKAPEKATEPEKAAKAAKREPKEKKAPKEPREPKDAKAEEKEHAKKQAEAQRKLEEGGTAAFTAWSLGDAQSAAAAAEEAMASIGLLSGRFKKEAVLQLARSVPLPIMATYPEIEGALQEAVLVDDVWIGNAMAKPILAMLVDQAHEIVRFFEAQAGPAASSGEAAKEAAEEAEAAEDAEDAKKSE